MMRTVTFASVARPVRLTTVPCSVPFAAPAASELSVRAEPLAEAGAGPAAAPASATENSATPAARAFRPFIYDPPSIGHTPRTQQPSTLQQGYGRTMRALRCLNASIAP